MWKYELVNSMWDKSVRFLGIDKRVCLIGQSMYFCNWVKAADKELVNKERKSCVNLQSLLIQSVAIIEGIHATSTQC